LKQRSGGRVESALPVEMESKRIKIAKAHNLLVCVLLLQAAVRSADIPLVRPLSQMHKSVV